MTDVIALLKAQLEPLSPQYINIQDDSHLHTGHIDNTGGGHYSLTIVSEQFTNLSLIKRHRLVYDVVNVLMKESIHALSIQAKTPTEFERSIIETNAV